MKSCEGGEPAVHHSKPNSESDSTCGALTKPAPTTRPPRASVTCGRIRCSAAAEGVSASTDSAAASRGFSRSKTPSTNAETCSTTSSPVSVRVSFTVLTSMRSLGGEQVEVHVREPVERPEDVFLGELAGQLAVRRSDRRGDRRVLLVRVGPERQPQQPAALALQVELFVRQPR